MSKHRVRVIPESHWRAIPGYEGFYEVSICGKVRSLSVLREHGEYRPRVIPGRVLKQNPMSGTGYLCVTLWGPGAKVGEKVSVHRLVALAWVPNPDGYKLVRHKDDCRQHNHAENLAWGTHHQNYVDAKINGRQFHDKLSYEARLRLEADVKATSFSYGSGRVLAKKHGVHPASVSLLKRRFHG